MSQLSLTPQVCEAGPFRGYVKLHWIRAAAQKRRDEKVGALFHHLGVDNLRRAFRELDGSDFDVTDFDAPALRSAYPRSFGRRRSVCSDRCVRFPYGAPKS